MLLEDRLHRIVEERERIEREEAELREEALNELHKIEAEIEALDEKKRRLESFLGLDENSQRAGHGQIQQLCIGVLADNGGGLSSGEIKKILESENPGLKLSSVPSTLSRMMVNGRTRRDDEGKYYLT